MWIKSSRVRDYGKKRIEGKKGKGREGRRGGKGRGGS